MTTVAHNREQLNTSKTIKCKHITRGGGYSLEVPWECLFTGDKFSIQWLNLTLVNEGLEFKLI